VNEELDICKQPDFLTKLLLKFQEPLFFALVGFLSSLIDVVSLLLLSHFGVNKYLATAVAFTLGTLNGYFLNSRYSFKQELSKQRITKYFLVSLGGLLWTEYIILILANHEHTTLLLAKLVAIILVFFWNYILSKTWAFK
jgi:putative flippase GtrA